MAAELYTISLLCLDPITESAAIIIIQTLKKYFKILELEN